MLIYNVNDNALCRLPPHQPARTPAKIIHMPYLKPLALKTIHYKPAIFELFSVHAQHPVSIRVAQKGFA